jgi:hypothetical protein
LWVWPGFVHGIAQDFDEQIFSENFSQRLRRRAPGE